MEFNAKAQRSALTWARHLSPHWNKIWYDAGDKTMNATKGYYCLVQYCPDLARAEAANMGVRGIFTESEVRLFTPDALGELRQEIITRGKLPNSNCFS